MLTAIRLLHTVIWDILAGSILALPLAGVLRRFRWATILTGLVLLECVVLAVNRGRCPLSDLAQQFTADRADNFDIYLPYWLAGHNKVIFGVLFIAGELVVLGFWLRERSAASFRQANPASHAVGSGLMETKHQDSSTTTATSNLE
jgi:urea transporter